MLTNRDFLVEYMSTRDQKSVNLLLFNVLKWHGHWTVFGPKKKWSIGHIHVYSLFPVFIQRTEKYEMKTEMKGMTCFVSIGTRKK